MPTDDVPEASAELPSFADNFRHGNFHGLPSLGVRAVHQEFPRVDDTRQLALLMHGIDTGAGSYGLKASHYAEHVAQEHALLGQQRLSRSLHRTALGHVRVDANPLTDRAVVLEDGDSTDSEDAVDSILAAHAMLEDEGFAGGDGLVPGVHCRLGVLGVDRFGPAIALILGLGLAREAAPARLGSFTRCLHLPLGACFNISVRLQANAF